MKIRALIIGERLEEVKALGDLINRINSNVDIVGFTEQPYELNQLIAHKFPELLIIDLSGIHNQSFEYLRSYEPINTCSILYIGSDSLIIETVTNKFSYFIQKPIQADELNSVIKQITQNKNVVRRSKWMINDLFLISFDRLILPIGYGYEFIRIADILFFEADGNYTYIYLNTQRKVHITKQLHEFNALMTTPNFYRCHQSYIINLLYVLNYKHGDGGELTMVNNQIVPVSRQYRKRLITLLKIGLLSAWFVNNTTLHTDYTV